MKKQCQILWSHDMYFIWFAKTADCFQFNSIFSMSNHKHLSENRHKEKNEIIPFNIATLILTY